MVAGNDPDSGGRHQATKPRECPGPVPLWIIGQIAGNDQRVEVAQHRQDAGERIAPGAGPEVQVQVSGNQDVHWHRAPVVRMRSGAPCSLGTTPVLARITQKGGAEIWLRKCLESMALSLESRHDGSVPWHDMPGDVRRETGRKLPVYREVRGTRVCAPMPPLRRASRSLRTGHQTAPSSA